MKCALRCVMAVRPLPAGPGSGHPGDEGVSSAHARSVPAAIWLRFPEPQAPAVIRIFKAPFSRTIESLEGSLGRKRLTIAQSMVRCTIRCLA